MAFNTCQLSAENCDVEAALFPVVCFPNFGHSALQSSRTRSRYREQHGLAWRKTNEGHIAFASTFMLMVAASTVMMVDPHFAAFLRTRFASP